MHTFDLIVNLRPSQTEARHLNRKHNISQESVQVFAVRGHLDRAAWLLQVAL
jgi:hypothetical protein